MVISQVEAPIDVSVRPSTVNAFRGQDRIFVRAPFELNDRLKRIEGSWWEGEHKSWTFGATPWHARRVMYTLKTASRKPTSTDNWFRWLYKLAIDGPPSEWDIDDLDPIDTATREPWKHQVGGYNAIKLMPAFGFWWDMGTGKTAGVIWSITSLEIPTVLVLAPSSVCSVWTSQFNLHAPDAAIVRCLDGKAGSVAKRVETMRRCLAERGDRPCVFAVNYEAAWREPMKSFVLDRKWGMGVCDESHRIGDPFTKISKFCDTWGRRCARRVCLSGTPMGASRLNIFGQYRFLEPGLFGNSFVKFRQRYALMGGFEGREVVGWQNEDELKAKVFCIGQRVKKSDVLDLPPVVHITRPVEMPPASKKAYNELAKDFVTEVGEGVVTASNSVSKLTRLQQITSGFAVVDRVCQVPTLGEIEDQITVELDTAKADAIVEYMQDLPPDEPMAFFCRFIRDLESVQLAAEKLKRPCDVLMGGRNDIGAVWEPKPVTVGGIDRAPLAAIQIQAGGLGIDLTASAYCGLFSLDFSLINYDQALARQDRGGQTRSVTYVHFVCQGTVDEGIRKVLDNKRADQDSIMNTKELAIAADVIDTIMGVTR